MAEDSGPRDDDVQGTPWLTAAQRPAWLSMVRMMTVLPARLGAQLERDAELNFFEYHVLAMLSETAERSLRMSRLAGLTSSSLSRLSNVVKRLEGRGLVRRERDPDDGRATRAVLTDAGVALVEAVAPIHVAAVRDLVVDALSPAELEQVRIANQKILARLDPAAETRPEWIREG